MFFTFPLICMHICNLNLNGNARNSIKGQNILKVFFCLVDAENVAQLEKKKMLIQTSAHFDLCCRQNMHVLLPLPLQASTHKTHQKLKNEKESQSLTIVADKKTTGSTPSPRNYVYILLICSAKYSLMGYVIAARIMFLGNSFLSIGSTTFMYHRQAAGQDRYRV